jgi:RNA polymerase sigma-70 factor (ECF subfamily)
MHAGLGDRGQRARDSFDSVMGRLRAGEEDAARAVFDRFAGRLVALAARQFGRRLACKVDPEDVALSAFKSFFIRYQRGALRVGDWNNLWALLTLIALRKCADRVEYLRAERRDAFREVSTAEGEGVAGTLALDREPSPQEAATLAETVERLFASVEADVRPVLELSLQGYTAEEISLRLGRGLRTVQRLREQVRKRLERMRRED